MTLALDNDVFFFDGKNITHLRNVISRAKKYPKSCEYRIRKKKYLCIRKTKLPRYAIE